MNTRVEDMVVLVVDEAHSRHGQVGRMLYHDWLEHGGIGVEFNGGVYESFYDGIMKGNDLSELKRFYRHLDEKGLRFDKRDVGPEAFQREFLKLGVGDLNNLAEQYKSVFGENLPSTSFLRKLPLELLIKFKDWRRRN